MGEHLSRGPAAFGPAAFGLVCARLFTAFAMHRLTVCARTAAFTAPLVLIGCALRVGPSAPPNAAVQLANPASTYCVQQGGKLSIQKDAAGNQSGLCTLPDGTAMDEWALFRRDHPAPESK